LFSNIVCLLICRLNANTTEYAFKFQGTLQMGQKVIITFWWESGLSSAYRNHLTTFCRPFAHYTYFRLCSAITSLYSKQLSLFVCGGWPAQTSPKPWFGKHKYDVKLWRHKQRTPNTNDTIRHWMKLLMKIFCVRHWRWWWEELQLPVTTKRSFFSSFKR